MLVAESQTLGLLGRIPPDEILWQGLKRVLKPLLHSFENSLNWQSHLKDKFLLKRACFVTLFRILPEILLRGVCSGENSRNWLPPTMSSDFDFRVYSQESTSVGIVLSRTTLRKVPLSV